MSAETAAAPLLTSEEDYRLDLTRLLIVVSVMLAVLLEVIDMSIVNVSIPSFAFMVARHAPGKYTPIETSIEFE